MLDCASRIWWKCDRGQITGVMGPQPPRFKAWAWIGPRFPTFSAVSLAPSNSTMEGPWLETHALYLCVPSVEPIHPLLTRAIASAVAATVGLGLELGTLVNSLLFGNNSGGLMGGCEYGHS